MIRLAVVLVAGVAVSAQTEAKAADLERGRYIVERVGLCGDCHTPRGPGGVPVAGEALRGAPIGVAPKLPVPGWGEYAPSLAGLPPHFTEVQMAHFLETGFRPDCSRPGPPMPEYRMSPEDAASVAAYLHSMRR